MKLPVASGQEKMVSVFGWTCHHPYNGKHINSLKVFFFFFFFRKERLFHFSAHFYYNHYKIRFQLLCLTNLFPHCSTIATSAFEMRQLASLEGDLQLSAHTTRRILTHTTHDTIAAYFYGTQHHTDSSTCLTDNTLHTQRPTLRNLDLQQVNSTSTTNTVMFTGGANTFCFQFLWCSPVLSQTISWNTTSLFGASLTAMERNWAFTVSFR